MTTESLKETIKRELPTWLREDPAFRSYVLELTRNEYADRKETGDRFYELLGELRRDREKQERKWEANQAELERTREEQALKWEANQAELKRMREEDAQKWAANQAELERMREEQAQKWEANQAELKNLREEEAEKWDEQAQKWAANQAELQRMRDEDAQKWEQQNRRWDENQAEWRRLWDESRADSNRRWDENQEELKRLHNEIMAQAQKFDRGIGALGSRWGLQSEKAFRDALAAILEQSFDVQVVNVTDYDDSGEVFGRPDQIELDVIIKNGLLLICELKSSIDKAGMYIFERKARFYERRHERKADRLIVISPMIDARARKVGERLGIEMYGDSTEVEAV
jgi:hypothetical protein